jgi:hypothetical protein
MILGPNDPRAVTGADLEIARKYTERFNRDVLGLDPLTPEQLAEKDALLDAVLDLIGYDEDDS